MDYAVCVRFCILDSCLQVGMMGNVTCFTSSNESFESPVSPGGYVNAHTTGLQEGLSESTLLVLAL